MPRDINTLMITDLSAFAKTLRADLLQHEELPSHVTMLSLIAKAAGYANYQQLKADGSAAVPLITSSWIGHYGHSTRLVR